MFCVLTHKTNKQETQRDSRKLMEVRAMSVTFDCGGSISMCVHVQSHEFVYIKHLYINCTSIKRSKKALLISFIGKHSD